MKKPPKGPRGPRALPSREELLAFIGTHKGKAGVREIARAFGLKNNDRAALKTTLRELGGEGKVERRRKKLHHAGTHVPPAPFPAEHAFALAIALVAACAALVLCLHG